LVLFVVVLQPDTNKEATTTKRTAIVAAIGFNRIMFNARRDS